MIDTQKFLCTTFCPLQKDVWCACGTPNERAPNVFSPVTYQTFLFKELVNFGFRNFYMRNWRNS